jgi:nitrite reductase/ring-hydroxylating ferredoxin subunit
MNPGSGHVRPAGNVPAKPAFKRRAPMPVCASSNLVEQGSYKFPVLYRGVVREAILVRHRGVAYGYLNRCVHMDRALDCEQPHVFDESGTYIRCSMHGIVYEPATGLCRSDICAGKSLTALKIDERDGLIHLVDKRASTVQEDDSAAHGQPRVSANVAP